MWLTWREATERALYGADGFYRRADQPARHFRTSVHASAGYAAAVYRLLSEIDTVLGRPACLDVVDIGAGGGEFASRLSTLAPSGLRDRLRITAVDLAPPPPELPSEVTWTADLPATITGLVIANEWLDNIALDVVEQTATGPRLVLVDPDTGAERVGGPPSPHDQQWLSRWWPTADLDDRAEVGRPRDQAWTNVLERINRGVAVAIDYAHTRETRPPRGTLTGFRAGRSVPPVPDGSCDVSAHVALDACAAAGAVVAAAHGGRAETGLATQRDALRALGVRGERPPIGLAETDPTGYLRELQRAGEEGELLDPDGLGAFMWLVQTVNYPAPAPI